MAVTGYAVLCFLGAGYDHRTPNKWRRVVKGGIDYLLANHNDGVFDRRNYTQGIVTMAVAEAYAMTEDPALKDVSKQAVNVLLERMPAS